MNAFRLRCFALILFVTTVLAIAGSLSGVAALPVVEEEPENRAQLANLGLAYHLFDAVLNGQDSTVAATLIAEDAVIDTPSGAFTGPEGLLEYVTNVRRIYPDASFAITSLSATDEKVVIGWNMHATQFTMDATGRIDSAPLLFTGVFTVTVGGGEVAHMSTETSYMVAAGPSADLALGDGELVDTEPPVEAAAITGAISSECVESACIP